MIDFTNNGKRYMAGRGFMAVFDATTENKLASFMDVFRETDPTPEKCIELYSTLNEIAERIEKKPKQKKAKTKDPF
jgi:hypothetical protein